MPDAPLVTFPTPSPATPDGSSWLTRWRYDLQLRLLAVHPLIKGIGLGLCIASILIAYVVAALAKSTLVTVVALSVPMVNIITLGVAAFFARRSAPPGLIEAAFRRVGPDNADTLRKRLTEATCFACASRATVADHTRWVVQKLGLKARRRQARAAASLDRQRDTIAQR